MNRASIKLGCISKITMGQSPSGDTYNNKGIGFPLLNGPTEFGDFHPECTLFTTDSKRRCEPNDLIFCVRGSTTGKMNWADKSYSLGRGVCSISGKTVLHTKYIKYCIDYELASLLKKCSGSTFPNLSKDDMYELEIPYDRNWDKIALVLSSYNNLIENNNRRIAILEEMDQRLYREWFVHFRFPGHENVPMVESKLGMIPEGWTIIPFLKTVQVNPRYPKPRVDSYPYVEMADLDNSSMIVSSSKRRNEFKGTKFTNGDTLVARITPCLENGKTGYVQFLDGEEIGIGSTEFIVLHADSILPEMVYLIARQDNFREKLIKSMSGASGRQRANISALDDYCIPVPPSLVLDEFSRIVHPIFSRIQKLHTKNQILHKTRDLLLPRLISGDIDVSKIDVPVGEV